MADNKYHNISQGAIMNYRIWIMLTAIVMSGCATQGIGIGQYTDAQTSKVKNEMIISRPQSQVWDVLVKQLPKSSHVINNIDKVSRTIKVSFSSKSPAEYIDCGRSHRTYTRGDRTYVYDYDTAGSVQYKVAPSRQPDPSSVYYANINREAFLEGRSSISVMPDGKNQNSTVVTVNTRYIWTIRVKGVAIQEQANGSIISRQSLPEETTTISFNTNQTGQHTNNDGSVITCVSKGKLEAEIFNIGANQAH